MDKLIGRSDFAQLRKSCKGNAFVSMEAAQTYFMTIIDELNALYDETGELVTVLTQLEKRQDGLKKKLYRFVQEAQADPAKAPKAIRAAERLASTGEQIQVITGMIQDKVRKRQPETEDAVHIALQRSIQSAELARYALQCWTDDPDGQSRLAENNYDLLDRVKHDPMLLGITRQLGRMKEMLSELRRNDYAHGRGEKYSITRGRDLKNLLSGELALLASPATMPLFLRKYNAKGLLQYAKRERVHKGHGDIIVCLDESASTKGENAEWGKALALAVQDICAHEGRKFALIHFSGKDALRTDRFLPGNPCALHEHLDDDLAHAAWGIERASRLVGVFGCEHGHVARTQHDGAGTLGCAVQPEIGVFVKGLYFREAFERRKLHDLLARHNELHVVVAAVRLQLLLLGGNRVVFLHVGEHGVTVAQDLQGGDRSESGAAQGRLDGVSQGPFISRHRGNVDHLARELDRVHQVRQLHDSSFVDASRIAVGTPTCVPPPFPGSEPRPRS